MERRWRLHRLGECSPDRPRGRRNWYDAIIPDLQVGGCVLVVSHGNTLRALVKHLEAIPDDQIAGVDIPTGVPLVYELGPDLRPDALGGQYLDPHAARDAIDAIEAIRNQGQAA
jgi:2,3-bisphosphoglycerate-dependent phosphoglycerate mutase